MSRFLPEVVFEDIYRIPPGYFEDRGIRGVVFDIDNTLAPNGSPQPDARAARYLESLQSRGLKLCILSNNSRERVERFCGESGLPFVYKSGKPKKRAFQAALDLMELPPEQTAMVGDQIFTDILGGNRAGLDTVLVLPFDRNEKLFIKFKLLMEKPFLRRYYRKKQ